MLAILSAPAAHQRADPAIVAAQFGLTAAEADIAVRLLDGQAIAAIALARGAQRETVRGQVKTVLAKLGARTQGQAIGILARSLAMAV